MNKKAQAQIITTVLIILLVLAAIVIILALVIPFIREKQDDNRNFKLCMREIAIKICMEEGLIFDNFWWGENYAFYCKESLRRADKETFYFIEKDREECKQ